MRWSHALFFSRKKIENAYSCTGERRTGGRTGKDIFIRWMPNTEREPVLTRVVPANSEEDVGCNTQTSVHIDVLLLKQTHKKKGER